MRKKSLFLVVLLVVAAFGLSACGSSEEDSTGHTPGMGSSGMPSGHGTASDFNDADVAFASDMIVHHRQAVEMSQLAATRAKDPQVKALAARIESAQGPEIDTMSDWLRSWGKSLPEDHGGMDMSGSMPGMMSMQDMEMLGGMSGSGFDQMFLEMMIDHHRGAIEMAKTQQSDGENAEAVALAAQIQADQTAEIAEMEALLR